MNSPKQSKLFKYSYYDRRYDKDYMIVPENYYDREYETIPLEVYWLFLRFVPVEMIGIIWNIKTILDDVDFRNYMNYIYSYENSNMKNSGMQLRSRRTLFIPNTHGGLLANEMFSLITYNYTPQQKIDKLYNLVFKWYEFVKNNNYHKKIESVIKSKINQFYYEIVACWYVPKNYWWKNKTQKKKLFEKLALCRYYIANFDYIVCNHYGDTSNNFEDFDLFVNEGKPLKKEFLKDICEVSDYHVDSWHGILEPV